MNFHIVTFGCQMNANDSDWLSRALVARGYAPTAPEEADVFIVNTCSVREKPQLKVYSELGRIKGYIEQRPGSFAVVGGCVAQQLGEKLFRKFKFVRLVFGTDGTPMAPQAIARLAHEPGLRLSLVDFTDEYQERDPALPDQDDVTPRMGSHVANQAFVSIMQGCDNFCAYCIVPFVRGRQKSRASGAVLDECRALADMGMHEITLLGQNVNSYGKDNHGDGTTFAQLLHQVAAIPGIARLRFTTSHPKDIAPEVVEAFGALPNLCPHLHLPLQSGSDRILKAMGRKYDTARYMGIVERLRAARPDIALSTDFIVGFPGETDEDFQATLDMLRTVRFDASFSFRYSDRPGTRAEKIPIKVPVEVATRRLIELQAIQEEFTSLSLENMIGKDIDLLVEGPSRKMPADRDAARYGAGSSWRGHDVYNHVVNVICQAGDGVSHGPNATDLTGAIIRAHVRENKKYTLLATRI